MSVIGRFRAACKNIKTDGEDAGVSVKRVNIELLRQLQPRGLRQKQK